jgi:hypothetical protein
VPPIPFSSFRRTQLIFEMRYSEAFTLWDRTGRLWKLVEKDFTKLKPNQVQPNEQTFIADDRYVISAGLQRCNFTDHKPIGGSEKIVEKVATFANKVLDVLELTVLERIGFRLIFSLPCSSLAEAREKSMISITALPSRTLLFGVEPQSFGAAAKLEVDDGDFGYLAQLYPQEKKFDFSPPPDVLMAGLEKREEKTFELVLDFDFSTKKPLRTEAFDCKSWLMGWNKAIGRDADTFLEYLAGKHGRRD